MVPGERSAIAPCDLLVGGLHPGEVVSVTIRCDYGPMPTGDGRVFEAVGEFAADQGGRLAIVGAAPRRGSWTGDASGMGPWWSASRVDTTSSPMAGDTIPTQATVVARDGTATASWTRHRLSGAVRSVERRHSIAHTRTWLPTDKDPGAGLVVLGGSGGGMPVDVGYSLLASRGVAVCTVGYFGLPGLPAALSEIPAEVVLTAADELAELGVAGRVGILGASRGSELALLAASEWPDRFTGVVALAPSGVVNGGYGPSGPTNTAAWTIDDVPVPYRQREEAAVIPIERIEGPVITLVGGDDQLWPSRDLIAPALERRTAPHQNDVHLVFDDAGHQFFGYPGIPMGEPPLAQTHSVSGVSFRVGGTRRGNSIARDRSWRELLAFVELPAADRPGDRE